MRCVAIALLGWMSLVLLGGPAATAENMSISEFYGNYVGVGVKARKQKSFSAINKRDLDVTIKAAAGDAFSLKWTTVIAPRYAAKKRTRTATMLFLPSGSPNLWKAKESGDLLAGKPVVWAHISGASLFVNIAVLGADGGLASSVYKRTLTKDGMSVMFQRVRGGRRDRIVTGVLSRKK